MFGLLVTWIIISAVRFELRRARWEAQTRPLSYAVSPMYLIFDQFKIRSGEDIQSVGHGSASLIYFHLRLRYSRWPAASKIANRSEVMTLFRCFGSIQLSESVISGRRSRNLRRSSDLTEIVGLALWKSSKWTDFLPCEKALLCKIGMSLRVYWVLAGTRI